VCTHFKNTLYREVKVGFFCHNSDNFVSVVDGLAEDPERFYALANSREFFLRNLVSRRVPEFAPKRIILLGISLHRRDLLKMDKA
jgi:hypothetical protein